jgi:hypothetical protein
MTKTKSNGPRDLFRSTWWSAKLPQGWTGAEDSECATFRANPPLGALQISSVRKDKADITEEELKDFAVERIPPGTQLNRVSYGRFSGFAAEYFQKGLYWREWLLGSGHLLVYATYNVALGGEDLEADKIEAILSSLVPIQV